MQALIAMLLSFASTKAGQSVLTWLFSFVWKFANKQVKTQIATEHLKKHIEETMNEYDQAVLEAQEKAKDGLTEVEIADIEKKKIELELKLMNGAK